MTRPSKSNRYLQHDLKNSVILRTSKAESKSIAVDQESRSPLEIPASSQKVPNIPTLQTTATSAATQTKLPAQIPNLVRDWLDPRSTLTPRNNCSSPPIHPF
jgi:hypothetical protein